MNAVVQFPKDQFMSSKEVADLTGKLHKNVIRDIREMLNSLDGSILSHEKYQELKDARGYSSEFLLNKNLSLTLMTGYDINARHKINLRWQELESQVQESGFKIPQTYADALMLAAEQARQLEVAAPKVRHYDTVVERTTLLTATQVGQKVKFSAVKLNKVLEELDVYNKTLKRGKAFKQWFVDVGYGIMRQTDNGFSQPMFTTKGEAWVVEKLISEGVC